VGEGVLSSGRVGDDDHAKAGGGGGLVAGDGVLEGDGFVGPELEFFEGGEVEVGLRFAMRDVVATEDGMEFIQEATGCEVAVHVAVRGVGRDGKAEAGGVGGLQQGEHAGAEGGGFATMAREDLQPFFEDFAIVSGGEGAPDVSIDTDVADDGVEHGEVGDEAVFGVYIQPRGNDGCFGVHDKAVEIKYKSA